jgi:ribosome-associated protein
MNKQHKHQAPSPYNAVLDDDVWDRPSKTSVKKHMQDLQDLGISLSKLKPEKLKQLDLPEKLFDAISSIHSINANGALRRQYQYVGRLMRTLDDEYIQSIRSYLIEKRIQS